MKCRKSIKEILPLRKNEIKFLTKVNEEGEIDSKLLTADEKLKRTIKQNPALLWKIKNVKKHFNIQ